LLINQLVFLLELLLRAAGYFISTVTDAVRPGSCRERFRELNRYWMSSDVRNKPLKTKLGFMCLMESP